MSLPDGSLASALSCCLGLAMWAKRLCGWSRIEDDPVGDVVRESVCGPSACASTALTVGGYSNSRLTIGNFRSSDTCKNNASENDGRPLGRKAFHSCRRELVGYSGLVRKRFRSPGTANVSSTSLVCDAGN